MKTTVDSDVSDCGKHRGSLKYAQGGRFHSALESPRPADRGSFTRPFDLSRPSADRGTFPPAESLNKLSISSWTGKHGNDGRFRRFRLGKHRGSLKYARRFCTRVAESARVAESGPSSPSRSVPRSDWTTSATRFTESKLVGCARECPGQNARVCGRSADGGPLARATLKRPADRGSFTLTRVKRPADRGSFTRTRVKRPADRGSFPQAVVRRPADRGTFPPAESLNKLSFSSWTVPAL